MAEPQPPCQEGNRRHESEAERAFAKVYQEHFGLVRYVLKRLRISDNDAPDLVQEVFLKFYRHGEQIKEPQAVKAWLVTTAKNLAVDSIRKHKPDLMDHQKLVETAGSGEAMERRDNLMEVLILSQLIKEVSEKEGDETFFLFYGEGQSAKEIAAKQAKPISTVTNRLAKTRKKFREYFVQELEKRGGPWR